MFLISNRNTLPAPLTAQAAAAVTSYHRPILRNPLTETSNRSIMTSKLSNKIQRKITASYDPGRESLRTGRRDRMVS